VERLIVIWIRGVSLKNRLSSKELNEHMGVTCAADVVRLGRLRWFCHLEIKGKDEWMTGKCQIISLFTRHLHYHRLNVHFSMLARVIRFSTIINIT